MSKSAAKQVFNEWIKNKAEEQWKAAKQYERCKEMHPKPSNTYLKLIAGLTQKQMAALTQLRTEHTPLANTCAE